MMRTSRALRDKPLLLASVITEWKQALQQSKESEKRYRSMIELAPDGILTMDLRGIVTSCNAAFTTLTGFSKDEIVGKPILELPTTPAIHAARYAKTLASIIRGKTRKPFEFEWVHKDGSLRWGECHARLMRIGHKIVGIQAIGRDITERKRAEEELAKYRQHLEELVEERTIKLRNANEQLQQKVVECKRAGAELRIKDWAIASSINAILMADLEGNLIYVNASFLKMWGYDSSEETIGKPAVELWQDREKAASVVRRLLRKDVWQGELVALRADGSTFDAEVLASMVEDDEGQPICLMASMIEITERKKAEAALRASELWMRSIFNSLEEAVFVVTPNRVLVNMNVAAEKMFGYSTDELVDRSAEVVHVDHEHYLEFGRRIKEAFDKDEAANFEFETKRKNGDIFPTEHTVSLLKDDLEQPIGIVSVIRDITERKQAEEKLQRLYQKERELRQQLEAEMKRRVEFTRALAHELKTPLTPVVMSSQLLTSELKDETLLRVAQNISRGAANLNSRIDELLDLARGEIGMLQIKPEQVDVLQLLREVVDDVSPVASSRGQSLTLKLPPSLPPSPPSVWCDRVRLRQIVLNLLNNAFKFTPAGGKITLGARQEDGNLVVGVKDTGPGIAEEEQQRIFNPYHRLESDRERLSGLGLGLALCKTLVELHGGRIWVKSRAGKGSTFVFSLPLEDPGQ